MKRNHCAHSSLVFSVMRGFSVPEMLIASLFLLLMASIGISTFSEGRQMQGARASAHSLLSIVATAQSDALSGRQFSECAGSSDNVIGKVGIFFDISTAAKSSGVSVFIDKNDNRECDGGCIQSCSVVGGEFVKFIPFYSEVTIGNGGAITNAFIPYHDVTVGINASQWSLLFVAPDPRISLCRGSYAVSPVLCDYSSLLIRLWTKNKEVFYPFKVHTSGRIDVR